ncbi:SMI1/KNR4 family protein [uncultured Rummeliibacillus sp.]|uniref:SMI1/KNR4 family protein n=1 Tax=uncultured Rummeliibacillus sp. TaxID=762292 RepID=UPI00261A68A8|nr:SMI1/KNR4 family protein [uncultured Rummeliibacillus sp.]
MPEIKKVLDNLKSKLDENFSRLDPDGLIGRDGTVLREKCIFNPPAKEEDIRSLEKELGIKVPQDYREFLLLHNGMTLFKSYLMEFKFFSLDEIREGFKDVQEFKKEEDLKTTKDYPIGEFQDVGYIMVDAHKLKKHSSQGAIYVGHIMPEATEESFVTFVENVIENTGELFWEDSNLPEY